MNVKIKIMLAKVKYNVRILGLVILGIVIGVSYMTAYQEYVSMSWGGGEVVEHIVREDEKASTGDLHLGQIVEAKEGISEDPHSEEETPSLSIEDTVKKIAQEQNIDWKILYAICLKESNCDSSRTGDGGKSKGAYQIYSVAHPDITEEQARDFEWATEWTAKRLKKNEWRGEYEMIRSHNGLVTWNNYYVDDVYKIIETL